MFLQELATKIQTRLLPSTIQHNFKAEPPEDITCTLPLAEHPLEVVSFTSRIAPRELPRPARSCGLAEDGDSCFNDTLCSKDTLS